MSMLDWLTGKQQSGAPEADELANVIAAVSVEESKFAYAYLSMIYTKIMHEAADRAAIPEGVDKAAYTLTVHDSYSPYKKGLVSLLVEGMVNHSIKYYRTSKSNQVILFEEVPQNEATDENGTIKAGILELDFREFLESKVLEMLFSLLSGILQSMSNGVTISQAVLLKIHELSKMIDNQQNIEPLKKQLRQLNDALTQGKPGVVDAKSALEFPEYNPEPAEKASGYVFALISSLTGLPASYLFGEVVGGLGDTSNSDEKRLDAAIRRYFHSIFAPALVVVFTKSFEYKLMLGDSTELVALLQWLESSTLITPEGKSRIILNNTPLIESDIDTTPKKPEPTNPGGNDNVIS